MIPIVPLLLLLPLAFLSCNFLRGDDPSSAIVGTHVVEIETAALQEALTAVFTGDASQYRGRISHFDTLAQFYRDRQYAPLWVASGPGGQPASALIAALTHADDHGLDPAAYNSPEISRAQAVFRAALERDSTIDYRALAALDVALSGGLVDYARHLRYGLLDPTDSDHEYTIPLEPRTAPLFEPLHSSDIVSYLDRMRPRNPRYVKLQQALTYYRWLAVRHPWQPIPAVDAKPTVGAYVPNLEAIAQRLLLTSDDAWIQFSARSTGNAIPDAELLQPKAAGLDWNRIRSGIYDTTLYPLVVEFQRNHGLLPDGVLGKRTIETMNVPATERIEQIRLNLDRFRWFDYPDSSRYVRVNIPDFHVYLCDSARETAKIKVCVGMRWRGLRARGYMPMTYQTPVLRSEVAYMVLNPTWSVPESIAKRETYIEELRRPGYLSRHNYRVYKGDSIVDPGTVDWTKYKGRSLPFRFVQNPGAGNALGRLKFLFNNPFDVYMHDTPKRSAFNLASRTVSHGCIRVQEPMRVVSFLFPNTGSWTLASTKNYLASTRTTRWITLERSVPIYVDYVTAWVNADFRIQFRDDVYKKDLLLKTELPPLSR